MIPKIVKMDVYPVAGHDSMELNLSGAHAPYFTRNVVVLEDSTGNLGVGEVPGGQKITKALEDVKPLARWMFPLAERRFFREQFEDVAYFVPFYLKDFVAKQPKKLL